MEDNEKGKNLRVEAEEALRVGTLELAFQNSAVFMPVFEYGVHMFEMSGIDPWRIHVEALNLQKKVTDADSFIQRIMARTPPLEIYNAIIDEIVHDLEKQLSLDNVQMKSISLVVNAVIHNIVNKKFGHAVEHQLLEETAKIVMMKLAGLDQSDGENKKENQWTQK